MRHSLFTFFALLAVVGWTTTANGQESEKTSKPATIEILNQDGEKVSPKVVAPSATLVPGSPSVRFEAKDGKIVIVDEKGNRQEIEAKGAKEIVVAQQRRSSSINGKQETKQFGKAIIVGPDGKRQEIVIGDGGGDVGQFKWAMPGTGLVMADDNGVFKFDQNKFMIGVNCQPVSDAMTSQLRLESGVGLLVSSVNEDSPAAKAGIKLHDILLYAGQDELKTIDDLVKVVQESGEEDASFNVTLLRGGEEASVAVKAIERAKLQFNFQFPGSPLNDPKLRERLENGMTLQFDDFGPGAIIQHRFKEQDMDRHMQEMKRMMEQLRKELREEMKQMRDQDDN